MKVLLYNIRSSHNVGSILRTSDAAGIEKLFLGGITPTPIDMFKRENAHLTKVSLGAEKTVPWEHVGDSIAKIKELKMSGNSIIAIEQSSKSIPYSELVLSPEEKEKAVVVMGSEVEGLPQEVLDLADHILEIPMKGQKESLNVAVAFGIVVFRLL